MRVLERPFLSHGDSAGGPTDLWHLFQAAALCTPQHSWFDVFSSSAFVNLGPGELLPRPAGRDYWGDWGFIGSGTVSWIGDLGDVEGAMPLSLGFAGGGQRRRLEGGIGVKEEGEE